MPVCASLQWAPGSPRDKKVQQRGAVFAVPPKISRVSTVGERKEHGARPTGLHAVCPWASHCTSVMSRSPPL